MAPPFLGGLVGYLGYDLGLAFEPRRTRAKDDQGLPPLRLGLYDWTVAWDRRTGRAWLDGRALDGDRAGLERRLATVRERLRAASGGGVVAALTIRPDEPAMDGLRFTSSLDRRTFEAGVEAVRDAIARGEIYQANLSRRLQAPFRGDPWALYRCLRTGDPALFAAYLDLGPSPAAPGRSRPRRRNHSWPRTRPAT